MRPVFWRSAAWCLIFHLYLSAPIALSSAYVSGDHSGGKTISQGVATSVWAAVVASADEIGGRGCEDCHVSEIVPEDTQITNGGVRAYALDPKNAGH
ncbi:MAG TPA: hypothetical protein VF753_21285 [Terriglobales bacterium]